jgi:glycosyltransferase involved in cell wall biosynthesis
MSLVFVGDACCDHSDSGGYHQLCHVFPEAGWLSGRAFMAGQLAWLRAPADPDLSHGTFHVLYGDCSGRELPAALRTRFPAATVVASAHQPPGRLEHDPAAVAALGQADVVVTVSDVQAAGLAQLGATAPAVPVPHGVWTRAFRAPPRSSHAVEGPRPVLVVGTYLRAWDATQRVLAALGDVGVPSVVVGTQAGTHLPAPHPLVHLRGRVTEAELIALYDGAAALLLPVSDATASNALLEAISLGCPVVAPALPALTEYLGDDRDCYRPGHHEEAVELVLRYAGGPRRRDARSRVLTRRARSYDWGALKPRYEAVYRSVTT